MNDSSKQITLALYRIEGQNQNAQVLIKDSTIWAMQKIIAELFGVDKSSISRHIANIYTEGELSQNSTIAKIATLQKEGNRDISRDLEYYNLDMIISVGYRVNSKKATHFRIWATNILKEFTLKGFVLDDERLKQGGAIFSESPPPPTSLSGGDSLYFSLFFPFFVWFDLCNLI